MIERIAELVIEIILGVSIGASLITWGMMGQAGMIRSLRWALSRHS